MRRRRALAAPLPGGGADTAARRDQTRPRQPGRRARRTSSRAARGSAAPRPARASGAPRTRRGRSTSRGARARLWHRRLPARPGGRPRSASAPGSGAPRGVGEAHPARHRARRAAAPGRGQRGLQELDLHERARGSKHELGLHAPIVGRFPAQKRQINVRAGYRSEILTNCLPTFSPRSIPRKAEAAFSIPSATVSRYFSLPS